MRSGFGILCIMLLSGAMLAQAGVDVSVGNTAPTATLSDNAALTAPVPVKAATHMASEMRRPHINVRVGGDTCGDAVVIPGLPYTDGGDTSQFNDDYDEVCPYAGSTSADVVYVFSPVDDVNVNIDLCLSAYDTKVYVYENTCPDPGNPYACNDDHVGECDVSFRSYIGLLPLTGGNDYFIVVDGYGGANGVYELTVSDAGIIPEGACCVAGECVETNYEDQCLAMNGDWFIGETCPEFQDCPQPPEYCPIDSVVSYPYQEPDGDWSFGVSDVRYTPENSTLQRYDSFADAGLITGMRFWGLSLSNPWANCTEDPFTVEIGFYGAGAEPGALIQAYTVDLVGTPTGLLYSGFEMIQYDLTLVPAVNVLEGWVSILGISEGSPDCWFLWANSDYGDSATHLMSEDGAAYTTELNDLSMCLIGNYVPEFGACCNDDTGVCEDGVEIINCFGRFVADTLCVNLDPPCEPTQGACCDDATGICLDDVNVLDCATRFVEGALCVNLDPQCGQIPGACCYDDGTCAVVIQSECVPFTVVCGDFEPDGDVDIDDYFAFVGAFGSCYGDANWSDVADLDGDCCVTLVDYQLWIQCFRNGGTEVGATFLGEYTTCDQCPCMVVCPPCPITPEGEPDCGDLYEDMYNGGCNSTPAVFGEIAIGETICGTSGTYVTSENTDTRDTDWFAVETTEPMILTWTVKAEFPVLIFIIDGGSGDCVDYTILGSVTGEPCQEVSFSTECAAPGLYWMWVGPSVFTGWPCPLDWYGTLTAEPCSIPTGACCVAGICAETNYEAQCLTLGGDWFIGETCPEFTGCPQPPENDLCENATPITGTVTDMPFDTTLAYHDGTGTCMTSANVWFCYTAEADGEYTIELCGSTFDTKLAVYDRCVCDPMGAELGCNDDSAICDGDSLQSALVLNLFADHQYLIEVGGYSSNVGPGDLSVFANVVPTGACCVEEECVATNFEYECTALGGSWYEGMECPAFECPVAGEGDTCATALPIAALPFTDTGDTSLYNHDYDEVCDYTGSLSSDVVYVYSPVDDIMVDIDLCDSLYDTKVYVYENTCPTPGAPFACNDDHVGECEVNYRSYINDLMLTGGNDYYIVVDGYGSANGVYTLVVSDAGIIPEGACCVEGICVETDYEPACLALGGDWFIGETCPEFTGCPEPCIIECVGTLEGEPVCEDAYVDLYNGGCNSDPFVFQTIACEETICGTSGTYLNDTGGNSRDTDWFLLTMTDPGTITWTVTAEFPVLIFIIQANSGDCVDYTILGNVTAEECVPATLSFAVGAGDYWLWVGPSVFEGVPCGADYEGIVTCTADGAAPSKPAVGQQPSLGDTIAVSPKKF